MKRIVIFSVVMVTAALAGLGWWLRTPALPEEPGFHRLDLPELALWSRGDQVEVQGRELQLSGSKAVIWLESLELLGPVLFQLSGASSRVVVSSGAAKKQFEASSGAAGVFLEWQPSEPRRHRDRSGLFYRLVVSFPDQALGVDRPRLALLGTREYLDRDLYGVEWLGCGLPETVAAGDDLPILVHLKNVSPHAWPHQGNARVRWVARWHEGGNEVRTDLGAPVESGEETARWLRLRAPSEVGRHVLEIDLEHVPLTLFSAKGAATCDAEVEVR